jgi:hypothetical protein
MNNIVTKETLTGFRSHVNQPFCLFSCRVRRFTDNVNKIAQTKPPIMVNFAQNHCKFYG